MARPDDDALSWGDDDPTLDVGDDGVDWGESRPTATVAPGMVTAQVTGADGITRTREVQHPYADDRAAAAKTPRSDPQDAPLGSVALVSLGVLGGVYALFAVGWFLAGGRFQIWGSLFVDPVTYAVFWTLATAAPVVWFVSVLVLARRRALWQRVLLLVLGALLLLPWPFLMTGVIAA